MSKKEIGSRLSVRLNFDLFQIIWDKIGRCNFRSFSMKVCCESMNTCACRSLDGVGETCGSKARPEFPACLRNWRPFISSRVKPPRNHVSQLFLRVSPPIDSYPCTCTRVCVHHTRTPRERDLEKKFHAVR